MKALKRIAPWLAIVILWLLYKRWESTFRIVEIEDAQVSDREGIPRRGKKVRVQSILDAPPEAVWDRVTTPALLTHVAYPVLTFERRDGAPLPDAWREGDALHLNLFLLGFIPLGPHTIAVERIDAVQREIQSEERGQMAETWRHFISVEAHTDHRTLYTDEIEIYAGALTTPVAWFARFFYLYRQTRWRGVTREPSTTQVRQAATDA